MIEQVSPQSSLCLIAAERFGPLAELGWLGTWKKRLLEVIDEKRVFSFRFCFFVFWILDFGFCATYT